VGTDAVEEDDRLAVGGAGDEVVDPASSPGLDDAGLDVDAAVLRETNLTLSVAALGSSLPVVGRADRVTHTLDSRAHPVATVCHVTDYSGTENKDGGRVASV
jgi:hypothetical protein